ncbi:MAG: GDSL-type esterase/lipase family protein [Candidatus Bathyarchaeota archaeon]|nr:GDSL-type esterase/lipase family protein [Candidatus Bathyarchaeota archaeon]
MIYGEVDLHNVEELITAQEGDGLFLSRIPNNLRLTLNKNAQIKALFSAGCELRFNIKSDEVKIVLSCDEPAIAEVFQGDFLVSWHPINTKPTEISLSLPQNVGFLEKVAREKKLSFDAHLTRVILPYRSTVKLRGLEGETSLPRIEQTPNLKYLAYGSSITQGTNTIRPTGSYTMRTAHNLKVDLFNLGFGGGAHCESQIADYIADREEWNFATLEIGINMIGSFTTKEFQNRIEYFMEKVAKAHPEKWVFVMDLLTFYADYDSLVKKQKEFRKAVENAVKTIDITNLVYINGRKLLTRPSGLTFDLVHPSPAGMEEIAYKLSNIIKRSFEPNYGLV